LSPDGSKLAYLAAGSGANACQYSALTVRNLETGHERTWQVPPRDAAEFDRCPDAPTWSADGTLLGYLLGWESILNNAMYLLDPTSPGDLLGQPSQRVEPSAGRVWTQFGRSGSGGGFTAVDAIPKPRDDYTEAGSPRLIAIDGSSRELSVMSESTPGTDSVVFDLSSEAMMLREHFADGSARLQIVHGGSTTIVAPVSLLAFDWLPEVGAVR
jgi:hypothetical protein